MLSPTHGDGVDTNVESPSLSYLFGRLCVVEERVKAAVEARRATDPDPDDAFRGLYISDEQVDRLLDPFTPSDREHAGVDLLASVEAEGDAAEGAGEDIRLRRLARDFGLDPLDAEILLVALAVELDARFERLYGYLNDDVTRRRSTIGLALELCDAPTTSARARGRFADDAPLLRGGLLEVQDRDRPFLSRTLRVPDRVTAHLLGDDMMDSALAPVLASAPSVTTTGVAEIARAIETGVPLIYIRELPAASARVLAHAALEEVGTRALSLDLRDAPAGRLPDILGVAVREAVLTESVLVIGPAEAMIQVSGDAVPPMPRLSSATTTIIIGTSRWDPAWSREPPVLFEAEPCSDTERAACWAASLDGQLAEGVDVHASTSQFRLNPEQIAAAAGVAARRFEISENRIGPMELAGACREQNAAGLERLAQRIEPRVGWDDLVLAPEPLRQLRDIASRARWRRLVLEEWGMGGGGAGQRGISALFAGPSGTGKSLAAEVLAHDLGLDLFRVDLASVVDKYIGETEKNLGRIFDEAEGISGVLLFDEADALFGRRSEVRDSHDRYANIEVAYLLQRMESFDGVAILATNLRANLDEAFTRRLDIIVDFPAPDEGARGLIWERCLRSGVPREDGIDFRSLARRFDVSGGDIHNICVTAAYVAAEQQRPLGMDDLVGATEREYRKLGRLGFENE